MTSGKNAEREGAGGCGTASPLRRDFADTRLTARRLVDFRSRARGALLPLDAAADGRGFSHRRGFPSDNRVERIGEIGRRDLRGVAVVIVDSAVVAKGVFGVEDEDFRGKPRPEGAHDGLAIVSEVGKRKSTLA